MIWELSLKPPYIVPRIVRVEYQPTTESFSYSFVTPLALEVCRLSREVALRFYSLLVSGSAYSVYFNPNVDFLFCKSAFDPVKSSNSLSEHPILPFIDSQTNVSAIRFLVLDHEYWQHRAATNIHCPIKELRDFRKLEEVFIVAPTLEQWRVRKKVLIEWYLERHPHLSDDPPLDLERSYARERLQDASASSAAVPGFRIYSGWGCPILANKLIQCYGWYDDPPSPNNPHIGSYVRSFDEY